MSRRKTCQKTSRVSFKARPRDVWGVNVRRQSITPSILSTYYVTRPEHWLIQPTELRESLEPGDIVSCPGYPNSLGTVISVMGPDVQVMWSRSPDVT
jgi:hypothetical protein